MISTLFLNTLSRLQVFVVTSAQKPDFVKLLNCQDRLRELFPGDLHKSFLLEVRNCIGCDLGMTGSSDEESTTDQRSYEGSIQISTWPIKARTMLLFSSISSSLVPFCPARSLPFSCTYSSSTAD